MKSLAVTKEHNLEVVELPMPEIGDDCVLTKTIASGICNGTDLKIKHGEFKGIDQYPCLLGHEAVGEVIKVGKKVKRFKIGDKVMVPFLETGSDGKYAGYYSFWSGYSEYTVARDYEAMIEEGKGPGHPEFWDAYYTQQVLPAEFDPVESVMIVTFCEVLAAIRNFGFEKQSKIAVFGAGPVGLTFIKLMKLAGIDTVISVDVLEEKRKEAESAGADAFINSKLEDVVECIRKLVPEGVDYVLDAVGINNIINTAMYLLKENGQICVYGICPTKEMQLSWADAPQNWTLRFLHVPVKEQQAEAFPEIVEWVKQGKIKLGDYISHRIPFSQILEAFEMVENRVPMKKIVITYE